MNNNYFDLLIANLSISIKLLNNKLIKLKETIKVYEKELKKLKEDLNYVCKSFKG